MPMFSKSKYVMGIVTLLYDLTGSSKLKMAAFKLVILIHQLVDQIETKFRRLCECFGVQPSIGACGNAVQQYRKWEI